MTNLKLRPNYRNIALASILAACAIATIITAWQGFNAWNDSTPDIAYANCNEWSSGVPTLPPYTMLDRCYDPQSGRIEVVPMAHHN